MLMPIRRSRSLPTHFQLAQEAANVGDEGLGGGRRRDGRGHASRHANYHIYANDLVNLNHPL
jgi:hypothetical protein